MKGLEISKRFSSEWLLPFIDRELPELRSHIAVGRFAGSDALGADDHLSQDHSWGPTVEIYLDDDYDIGADELNSRINSAAPIEFLGTKRRGGLDTAITLRRTHAYIKSAFGHVPREPRDWLCCASRFEDVESVLYFLRHGSLFHDGSGQLTEYNFVWRLVERNDVIAMQIALGHFSKAVMRLHFYLDRDFAPYWTWLPHEFRRRAYSPQIDEQLMALPRLSPMEQSSAIQSICVQLRARILRDGVLPADIENPSNIPWFFRFRQEILGAITDAEIRNLTW